MYRPTHSLMAGAGAPATCTVRYVGSRRDNAEAALIQWRENYERRDNLVRKAHKEQVSINRIHVLTGIGRSTIYRILNATPPAPAPAKRRARRT
jgi:hypothetical protein